MTTPGTSLITRNSLQYLANKYSEDTILLFRRAVNKEKKSISHQGLIYLAKQRKVLTLKEIKESGSAGFQKMDLVGLNILARVFRDIDRPLGLELA